MSKVCQITGRRPIVGNNVSHSHKKTKRKFYPNLFDKKFYLQEEDRWIKLRISAAGIRIISKKGLKTALEEARKNGYIDKY
jgi:large subunit ribosomal protein L28